MSVQTRAEAFANLKAARGGKTLLTYVTSKRLNQNTVVAADTLPLFFEHLHRTVQQRPVDNLDFFVMTLGGDVSVPLMLQHLLRDFARKISVLAPAECFSAGTMIALGADEITMTPLGQLSPIDPSVTHPLNPQSNIVQPMPTGQMGQPLVPVEVEQVFSYLSLARDKAGMKDEESIVRAFEQLTQRVHPIALGEIHRTHSLIRRLAEGLLRLHMTDEKALKSIIESLTEKLFSHSYRISRAEARDALKLPVVDADERTERAMMELYAAYVADANMDSPFDAELDINNEVQRIHQAGAAAQVGQGQPPAAPLQVFPMTLRYETAFIGSGAGESVFTQTRTVNQQTVQGPAGPLMTYNVKDLMKWETTWNA